MTKSIIKIAAIPMLVFSGILVARCSDDSKTEFTPLIKQPAELSGAQADSGTLPAWEEGYFDIHYINTTTGESAFIIMPDGTQMLIDAASSLATTGKDGISARWNPQERGSQIIARYIKECMKWTGNDKIDYAVVTHFHNDHAGTFSTATPLSSNSDTYRINGMTEILDLFPVSVLVDRGYPDYNYPYDLTDSSIDPTIPGIVNNLRACAAWHTTHTGLQMQKFNTGSASQFVMKRNPGKFEGFVIRNIFVNGEVWTGSGEQSRMTFPTADQCVGNGRDHATMCPSENHTSMVMKLSYGNFDLFAGADNCNSGRGNFDWKGAEIPVMNVTGPVDVMKANHHGVSGANSQELLTTLDPTVIVVTPWQDLHPREDVYKRFVSTSTHNGNSMLFLSNIAESQKTAFGPDASRITAADGHIVIRVNPGGDSYHVYMLKDDNTDMEIKKAIGPLNSK